MQNIGKPLFLSKELEKYEVIGIESKDYAKVIPLFKNKKAMLNGNRSLFDNLLGEYIDGDYQINYSLLEKAIELKQEYCKDILAGQVTRQLESNSEYKKPYMLKMWELFLSLIREQNKHWRDKERCKEMTNEALGFDPEEDIYLMFDGIDMWHGNGVSEYLKEVVTEDDIVNNRTSRVFIVGKTKYQAGTKLTKIMSRICEYYGALDIKEKIVGNFNFQEGKNTDINISAHPSVFIAAGYYGNSCLSPEGENKEASIAAIGYPNSLMLYTDDFTWRAFAFVDKVEKRYAVYTGYPRENYQAQVLAANFFQSLGYTLAPRGFFSTEWYMSDYTIFRQPAGEHMDWNKNRDSHYKWVDKLITHNTNDGGNSIINVYECDNCNHKSFYSDFLYHDGMCEYCYNERSTCDGCGGGFYNEDIHYHENEDRYYCDDCFYEACKREEKQAARVFGINFVEKVVENISADDREKYPLLKDVSMALDRTGSVLHNNGSMFYDKAIGRLHSELTNNNRIEQIDRGISYSNSDGYTLIRALVNGWDDLPDPSSEILEPLRILNEIVKEAVPYALQESRDFASDENIEVDW